jgi:hypothetical protein
VNKIGLKMVAFRVFIDGIVVEVATLGDTKQAELRKESESK